VRTKPTLVFCIILDFIGWLTYLLPFVGEWGDMLWAPLSAYIFYRSFGGKVGALGSIINFVEETIPFTDFIPTFTIAYFYKKLTDKDLK